MIESAPQPPPADRAATWAELYTGIDPFVPEQERRYLAPDLPVRVLREMADPIVKAAYINDGVYPELYGNRTGKVGACQTTSREVVKSAWRAGMHAVYAESPDGSHGFVVLPTSPEEAVQIAAGHVPEDPLIIDPTYAQFADPHSGRHEPYAGLAHLDAFDPPGKAKIEIGLAKGHHTVESPYFIGRASALRGPDSGMNYFPGLPSPWDNPRVIPMEQVGAGTKHMPNPPHDITKI